MAILTQSLNQDLLVELFLKLPFKSLLRFKSVSKSWQSIITSSNFVKLRLRPGKFFIKISTSEYCSIDCEKLSDNFSSDQAVEILQLPSKILDSHNGFFNIIGSCNGLICFMNDGDEYNVWNPLTTEFKSLPKSSILMDKDCRYFFGFGYDKSIDDYKIVIMGCNGRTKKIEVLNLKSNSWRKINQEFNYEICSPFGGIFANGALHWLGYSSSSAAFKIDNKLVIAFDIEDEKFQVFPQPDSYYPYWPSFVVLGDCLCLCYKFYDKIKGKCIDVWIMEEYSVESSWTKLFTAPNGFTPLFFAIDGQIIGNLDYGSLVRFDIKKNSFQHISSYAALYNRLLVKEKHSLTKFKFLL